MAKEARVDIAFTLAKHIADIEYKDIPWQARELTKMDILDTLGTALAGSAAPGAIEIVQLVKEWGGKRESSIIIYGDKVPVCNAALANATMAHALDYDDTHDAAILHAGVSVVPAAFAASECMGKISGKRFIAAVALGIDVACRLGVATKLSPAQSGWVFTSVLGYFSAAAAAGKIFGLGEEKMINALGIAYSQAAGNAQCVHDGALTKRIQPALASKAGVLSAVMADRGITGAKNIISGDAGLYRVYFHGQYDEAKLTDELGKRFEVVNLSFKPYPCCRFNHGPIDATLSLVGEHDIMPQDVDEIQVSVGESAYNMLCQPLEVKQQPKTLVDAQFSIPYTVARAVTGRKVVVGDFTPQAIKDKVTLEIARRVIPRLVSELGRRGIEPAIVEIKTKRGVYSKRVDLPKGHPQNPLSWGELADKFRDCSSYAAKPVPRQNVEKVIKMVTRLEEINDVSQIMQLLSFG